MKKQKFSELSQKSDSELAHDLRERRVELRQMKFDLAAGKVKNRSALRNLKKHIAQLLTRMAMKKLEHAKKQSK